MMATIHTVIVKVQVPLAVSDSIGQKTCLVYDRERKHVIQQPISQRTLDLMKGDVRAFFEATWGDNTWVMTRRVPEQFW